MKPPQHYKSLVMVSMIFFHTSLLLYGQAFNKKLYTYEKYDSNNIIVYFNVLGNPGSKQQFDFYRIGPLSETCEEISGTFVDYNRESQKVFEGYLINGMLNGSATVFYENGKEQVSGHYSQNIRDSIWTFYYKNGRIRMVVEYGSDDRLLEFYTQDGKQLVSNGNGKFKWHVSNYIRNIKGEVKNGYRIGTWKNSQYTEYYDQIGNLQYGINDYNKEKYYETQLVYFYSFINEHAFINSITWPL